MPPRIQTIPPEATLDLRQRVLWPEKALAELVLPEDQDALHFGAYIGQALVGVASFFPDGVTVRLRKFAIDPAHQGQGIGRALVAAAANDLSEKGFAEIWCDARVTACGFYKQLGFEISGHSFDKQGVLYRRAHLALNQSAP